MNYKPRKIEMKKRMIAIAVLGVVIVGITIYTGLSNTDEGKVKQITFPSEDGLQITADLYMAHPVESVPLIVMFHQAHWSRGEYTETAARFNREGYNCMAVDLRSGNEILGVENLTAERAEEAGKKTRFVDALQDVKESLSVARRKYDAPYFIALGSSYSAGLVLKVAGDYPDLVNGIIAFSPAEYFAREGKPVNWVQESARNIKVPVFIASARKEKIRWKPIYDAIETRTRMSYIPIESGQHGSRALWSRFPESEGYWQVMLTFLKSFF